MSLQARPALIFFDAQFNVTQVDDVARQWLGHQGGERIGQPLSAAVPGLEAGLDEVLQAGSDDTGRYLSGSSTLDGRSCRIELVVLPRDCGGVLMIHDEGGERTTAGAGTAKLIHDLRTPLNAMVGWLHLLTSPGETAAKTHDRALAGLQRAVDQQRQLLDDWPEPSRADRAAHTTGATRTTDATRTDGATPADGVTRADDATTARVGDAGTPPGVGPDRPGAASGIAGAPPGTTGATGADALPGSTVNGGSDAPGTAIGRTAVPGSAPQRSTRPGSSVSGTTAPGTVSFETAPDMGRLGPAPRTAKTGPAKAGTAKTGTASAGGAKAGLAKTSTPAAGGRARAAASRAASSSERQADENPLSGVFILAVDDNREMLHALESLLGRCGAIVETASSVDEALKRYASWAAGGGERLLVSDLAMPDRDGLALVKEIRKLEKQLRLPRMPAIALSAHARPDERREAFASGFDLFLSKPVDPPVLLSHLRNLLDR